MPNGVRIFDGIFYTGSGILKRFSENVFKYTKIIIKWFLISLVVGVVCGLIGGVFHKCIEYVTEKRLENFWLIFLLPAGGILIVFIYHLCKKWGKLDTKRVILAADGKTDVPVVLAPLIFAGTTITHFFGGSAGREGAALQLGGSLGYGMGRVLRLEKSDLRLMAMGGMSGTFAALFGTPLTATVFVAEVAYAGVMRFSALLPCLIASVMAFFVSNNMGNIPVAFELNIFPEFSVFLMSKVALLAAMCGLLGMFFCFALNFGECLMKRIVRNDYFRIVLGGFLIVLLTVAVGNQNYNGAGMSVIADTMNGKVLLWAFLLKTLFTVITVSCGYKGGEIVPSFFIGATFGCAFGGLLGINPSFAAAIGFVSVFCSVVKCPMASVILAYEVFGIGNIPFFALACLISFLASGRISLYSGHKDFFNN